MTANGRSLEEQIDALAGTANSINNSLVFRSMPEYFRYRELMYMPCTKSTPRVSYFSTIAHSQQSRVLTHESHYEEIDDE